MRLPRVRLLPCVLVTVFGMAGCGDPGDADGGGGAAATGGARAAPVDRPPVVVVVIDTWRHDSLGRRVAGRSLTPNLDALAEVAVRFDQAVSASGWTLPSVASLLTGTWPTVHKARGKGALLVPITPDLPTAAEVFRDGGYRTLAVANAAFLSRFLDLDRGFDEFNHIHAYNDQIRRADRSVDDALEMLDRADRPPFLLLHLFDAHLDYDPPEATSGLCREGLSGPPPPLSMAQCRALGDPSHPAAAHNLRWIQALYHEEVAFVDQEVGRLIEELKRRGLWESCLFAVTADHGEEFWDHGGFEHGHTLYDELVHVPLLLKLPRQELAGSRVSEPVPVLDLMPTLFEAAGLVAPPSFLGRSLRPLMEGLPDEERPILCESTLYGDEQAAIRRGRYKLIVTVTRDGVSDGALYDLQVDPGETTDRSADEPQVARRLRSELRKTKRELHAIAQGLRDPQPKDMGPGQHDMVQESLRSLGYLQDSGGR